MSITVKSQAELDRIPLDTDEQIYIEFGSYFTPAIVRNKYRYSVVAKGKQLRCSEGKQLRCSKW